VRQRYLIKFQRNPGNLPTILGLEIYVSKQKFVCAITNRCLGPKLTFENESSFCLSTLEEGQAITQTSNVSYIINL
jgi:hypothetical protein